MAHFEQQQFCLSVKNRFPEFFFSKRVLDIGSLDINGSNRQYFQNCDYIGLDVGHGKNVDVISLGGKYSAPDSFFDTIISTEVFEHDLYYEETIKNVIRMLKVGGAFIFTCAAPPRAEHGTRKSDGSFAAPLLQAVSEEWSDYYQNLESFHFTQIPGFIEAFPDGEFIHDSHHGDLYFFGVKGGTKNWKQLNRQPIPIFHGFEEDVFVVDSWPDNKEKEKTLIECITRLKKFSIPIVLVSHYPLPSHIQKLANFYLYSAENPILPRADFIKYNVSSGKWSMKDNWKFLAEHEFHHDYAIWESLRMAFNFCKSIGKKYIHFLEYDCLIEPLQYKQAFIDHIRHNDAVIWEYYPGSTKGSTEFGEYCSTFIFSIRTEVAINTIIRINSLAEYFVDRPHGWQLERSFLRELRKVTNNIHLSEYIDNEYGLNVHAVWNRDSIIRDGALFQIHKAIGSDGNLYLHTISGFYEKPTSVDYLVEIRYAETIKLHTIRSKEMEIVELGKYRKGEWIKVFYRGLEVFSEFLYRDADKEEPYGSLVFNGAVHPEVRVNFINGCRVEIGETQFGKTREYRVEISDSKTSEVAYSTSISAGCWAATSAKYFKPWKVQVTDHSNQMFFQNELDLTGQRVLISFESRSLGDTLAWLPAVDLFQKKWNCRAIVSTFHNYLFEKSYPEVHFVMPGEIVQNIYAQYSIGLWYDQNGPDYSKHPINPFTRPLQGIATDILGLEHVEVKPLLDFKVGTPYVSGKYVCIAPHSTAQAKYWNYPGGWQQIINRFNELGYKVVYSSHEKLDSSITFDRIGSLTGVIDRSNLSLSEAMNDIANCELFIGISSGLSWLAWALNTKTVLISGFTNPDLEFKAAARLYNPTGCNDCWSRHIFDKGDWNWCPDHKNTDRMFECTKSISPEQVMDSALSLLV